MRRAAGWPARGVAGRRSALGPPPPRPRRRVHLKGRADISAPPPPVGWDFLCCLCRGSCAASSPRARPRPDPAGPARPAPGRDAAARRPGCPAAPGRASNLPSTSRWPRPLRCWLAPAPSSSYSRESAPGPEPGGGGGKGGASGCTCPMGTVAGWANQQGAARPRGCVPGARTGECLAPLSVLAGPGCGCSPSFTAVFWRETRVTECHQPSSQEEWEL